MLMSMQSVFIGGIVIAGFGAAGVLSAITASDWGEYAYILLITNDPVYIKMSSAGSPLVAGIYSYRACQLLIGTSVCINCVLIICVDLCIAVIASCLTL